jgi:alanine transaminase
MLRKIKMRMKTPALVANPNILEMQYAVRGPIPQRAAELRRQGREIIPCNIGNPQALGQEPLSLFRQVLGLLENPAWIARERQLRQLTGDGGKLLEEHRIPESVLSLCEETLAKAHTGMGAYTESKGMEFIRQAVAEFIDRRDVVAAMSGVPADPENIFLTNGASQGVMFVIDLLIASSQDGIMIPIPQYPLYSAAIRKAGGVQVNYYPDEERGWIFDRAILDEAVEGARAEGVNVKAIVVINPANPTGAILDEASVREVIEFAAGNDLMIIADEVYQENVYGGEFYSFTSVLGNREVPLVSLHSISKGFIGECGHRGGYFEIRNPPLVKGTGNDFSTYLTKQASVNLCANTPGQLLTYMMVRLPTLDEDIQRRIEDQKQRILQDLHDKAVMIRDAFAEMDGVECYGESGALYLFPRLVTLPVGTTDLDYCMALLEETGLCTVNGSGFGQRENTHHLRIAFLPPVEVLARVLPEWVAFHNAYVRGGGPYR